MSQINNYKKYSEFIESCYTFSQKYYTTVLDKTELADEFLSFYQGMNVFPTFPRPIIMPIRKHDIDVEELKLNNSLSLNINLTKLESVNKILSSKIKEYTEYLEKIKAHRNEDKVRRYFDYEIRDGVNKIVSELVNNSYITNAYCKLYELLVTYNLFVNCTNTVIKSFHICEHPGAFIYALRDYIKFNYPNKKLEFVFQSLNPKKSSIKKIFKVDDVLLLKGANNLDYGSKNTGDITDIDNIKEYIQKYKNVQFDIITSDCGLDCSDDFLEQEGTMSPIYFGAFISAIGLVSKGGSYICKLFSFNELKTIELLTLLCYFFLKVDICRTLTTKGASGEIYLVCTNFIYDKMDNKLNNYIDQLIEYYKTYNSNNFIIDDVPTNIKYRIIKYNYLLSIRRITNLNQLIFRILNKSYVDHNEEVKDYILQLTNFYVDYFVKYIKLNKLIK